MNGGRTINIDRIALTLDGVAADDARLLAGGLRDAIEAQLAERTGERPIADDDAQQPADAPLVTALRGQALVDAVAARLVATLGQGTSSWR